MKKPLYRLLYTVKMIFDVSTFYNSTERVASLIVKITNQVIRSCKRYITESGNVNIWDQVPEVIAKKLEECIQLNAQYKDAYYIIRDKKDESGKKKEFSFSEQYIFGRFDYFCNRLTNILNLFQGETLI